MRTYQLAEVLMVERSTVSHWRLKGLPHTTDEKGYSIYDLEECIEWLSNQTFAMHIQREKHKEFNQQNKIVSTNDLREIYNVEYSDLYYWRKCGMPYVKESPKTLFYETEKVHDWLFNGDGWRFGLKLERREKEGLT